MKTLIFSMMMLTAAVSYAGQPPSPEPYCECKGKGIPVNTYPTTTVSPVKSQNMTFTKRMSYDLEEAWVFILKKI